MTLAEKIQQHNDEILTGEVEDISIGEALNLMITDNATEESLYDLGEED